MTKYFYRSTLC